MHPREIVSGYADLLASINENEQPEPLKLIPFALPESLLPFPSTTIRHALAIYLLHQNFKDKRNAIEDAYIYLDNFIPDEEYNLFHSLQASMSIKGRLEERASNKHIKTLEIMNRLRTRTKKIRTRKEESIEELNALRRIMNLPDDISEMDMDDFSSTNEEVQELALNL
ncbi:MAG: hypothetical protein WBB48_04320 [Thermodesulfobacteriota bacterium]